VLWRDSRRVVGFGANGLTVGAVLLPVSAGNRVAALVVLVVEDEPLLRCSVAESLREAGYTVVERASGEEATPYANRICQLT